MTRTRDWEPNEGKDEVQMGQTCMMGSMSSFQRAWLSSEVSASHSLLLGQCMK